MSAPVPVCIVSARRRRLSGLSATRQPDARTSEVWLLAALPKGFKVQPGDKMEPLAGDDRKARTVITAVAADKGATTLTCSVVA